VQVDDGEERLVGILQVPPLQERTDVVADLEESADGCIPE
jgi:hypothetical protein